MIPSSVLPSEDGVPGLSERYAAEGSMQYSFSYFNSSYFLSIGTRRTVTEFAGKLRLIFDPGQEN